MRATLGQLADIQIGYQVTGKITPQSSGTHLLVQTSDVDRDGGINWEALAPFTPSRKGADRYGLRDGDVLFLAKGARRVAALVRDPLPHALAVSTFYILRVREEAEVVPGYLAWFLNVAARDKLATFERQGVTIPFVPKEALADLMIELPDHATQRRVAALDCLARREKQLTLELLEQRARLVNMVTRRAVTGEGSI
jgi:hypothetical protein